jgi:PAS domain S-box-containing protein
MTWPLRFAVQYRDKIFPGVPIVFMSNDSPLPEKIWPGVTGVQSANGVRETIDLALRFHPDTQTVAVISPAVPSRLGTVSDHDWYLAEHAELLSHRDKVREIDLLGPAKPELLQRVAALPTDTVVLFQLYPVDSDQPAFGALDVLADVAQRFPTYSILPHITVGRGGVAGVSYDSTKDAVLAGELAARVLSGERADNIPVVQNTGSIVSVDWRQLRRWNIPESALPPGTLVLYREPTLWERGRIYFIAGIAVILIQTFLIVALFWQRARKRRAEAELRKSEERFSKTFRQSPLVVTISRTSDSRFLDVNESFEEQFGWTRDEVMGRTPADLDLWVDADQRAAFSKQLRTNASVRNVEVCLRKKDGETRTALVSAELIEVGGEPCTVSIAADITERKRAEDVLSTVSRKLIEAHEEERTRIARELHDEINQRLAFLAVKLSSIKKDVPASDTSTKRSVDEVRQDVSDLGKDVQALSHRLHSSKLEYLGLAVAAGGFCKEFSERCNVEVVFHYKNIPRNLPPEISLSLFRVLQEALQNALKYSGTRRFEATLEGTPNEIHLSVHDSGVGFDPESTMNRQGLGLISMTERLKLVDGQLSIESKPQCGTTIHASVPLRSNVRSDVQVKIATA